MGRIGASSDPIKKLLGAEARGDGQKGRAVLVRPHLDIGSSSGCII